MTTTGESLPGRVSKRLTNGRTGLALVAALLVLPALAGAVSLLGRHWYAAGDRALEVLLIGDVGGRHTPLVGMPSRFGWYHPGPLLFWLLAPMAHLFGETGVLAGVAILNAAALVGVAIVARRRGGMPLLLWTGLLVAALVHTEGPGLLLDPWNPWVPVLPFLCFALLSWSVACGDYPALPWAVLVGSFVVETHVGYALLVAGSLAVALVIAALGALHARRGRHLAEGPGSFARSARRTAGARGRTWLALAVLIAVAAWTGPLVQQLGGSPGNLGAVARYFTHTPHSSQAQQVLGGPPAGWSTALGIMGEQLAPPGPWLTGHETNVSGFAATAPAWPALLLALATCGAGVMAWRRRANDAALLALLAVVLALLGFVATARITGGLSPYLIRWWWVVALLLWLSIGWCVAAAFGRGQARLAGPVAFLVASGGLALVGFTLAAALPAPLPEASVSKAIANLAPSTARALRSGPPGRGELVVWNDPQMSFDTGFGMFTELSRLGFHVVVPAGVGFGFGATRTSPPVRFEGVVTVVGVPEPGNSPQPPPGSRLVASYDPLSAQQRLEADRLEERIRAALGSHAPHTALVVPQIPLDQAILVAEGAPARDLDRLAGLQAEGSPYQVFFTPSTP